MLMGAGARMVSENRSSTVVVELDVPIEVIPPAFRYFAEPDGDANRGQEGWPFGRADELKAGLVERLPPLESVAVDAACNDIFPVLAASPRDRYDVVECQLKAWQPSGAVLATVFVAKIDIGT